MSNEDRAPDGEGREPEESREDVAGRRPDMIAYTVREGPNGTNYWNRVGASWSHRDGRGSEIVLESIPVDGRITLREQREERLDELEQGRRTGATSRDRSARSQRRSRER